MATPRKSQALVPATPPTADEAAIGLANALLRLDAALDAAQARMTELAEAHRARQAAAKKVPTERIKPATRAVKPGTGTLRLAGDKPGAPRPARPLTRPMPQQAAEVVEAFVPEASHDDAADRLLKTLEAQADRLGAEAPPAQG